MKKQVLTAMMATVFFLGANAQTVITNDDGSPLTEEEGQTVFTDDYRSPFAWDEDKKTASSDDDFDTAASAGLVFFSFDGGENYGGHLGGYVYNNVGWMMNGRYNFKKDYSTFNMDVTLNYSFGTYRDKNTLVMIAVEAGPSWGEREVIVDLYKGKTDMKDFLDGFAGIKAVVAMRKGIVLSAGYCAWAMKCKFEKDYLFDGFYAQLGISL